jgi:hypothetical protein
MTTPDRSAPASVCDLPWGCPASAALEDTVTTEQKIIRAKVGLLELAKQLGHVSQACKLMTAETASTVRTNLR